MEWLEEFPSLSRGDLRDLKKAVDFAFRDFARTYGDGIEAFFEPLKYFMVFFENVMVGTPWPIMIAVFCGLAWLASRSLVMVVGTGLAFATMGILGMWEDAMSHGCHYLCCHPGMYCYWYPWWGIFDGPAQIGVQALITPVLDIMQTIPSFVYLIPIIMLLGIGKVPGLIAVIIYALPPIVRLTNLGIRLVDKEVLEAADAFGASAKQKLFDVQIPLALPNIFAGG